MSIQSNGGVIVAEAQNGLADALFNVNIYLCCNFATDYTESLTQKNFDPAMRHVFYNHAQFVLFVQYTGDDIRSYRVCHNIRMSYFYCFRSYQHALSPLLHFLVYFFSLELFLMHHGV